MAKTIVWFQNDLRLSDNPALSEACRRGAVVPLFVFCPGEMGPFAPGEARRWWLHHSLKSLEGSLERRGSYLLVLRSEDSLVALSGVAREVGADAVYWNERHEPTLRARDERVKRSLEGAGLEVRVFRSYLLHDPQRMLPEGGPFYSVFTPFWKRFLRSVEVPRPLPAPARIDSPPRPYLGQGVDSLGLLPKVDWASGIRESWQVGEEAASRRLKSFLEGGLSRYAQDRDRPDLDGTSRLSPHLHHGEISPAQVWHGVLEAAGGVRSEGAEAFLRELGWREFSYHLLCHRPDLKERPLREEFNSFPWSWERDERFLAWTRGQTGIPIVDAGMRQLWRTGWMHNRVRMLVASWLTKNLLVHWRLGEEWFWDTLVDADPASNPQGWQWTAGCGADAAPYFRMFNPVSQARRFDPDGAYVRRWVEELSRLPAPYVHAPWEAPGEVLKSAGVKLGLDYPLPQLSPERSRAAALELFGRFVRGRGERGDGA